MRKLTTGLLFVASLGLVVMLIGGLLFGIYGPRNSDVGPGLGLPTYPHYVWGFLMLFGGLGIFLCSFVSIVVLFIYHKLKKSN